MKSLAAQLQAALQIGITLLVAGGTASLLGGAAAFGQPSITRAVPGALAAGQTIEVTFRGTKLDGPLHVWTSFPAQTEVIGDPKQKGREQVGVKLTLPNNVPVGIGGLVLTALSGASEVVYLMIDDLPSVAASGKNHTAAEAQEIALPVAIDGLCEGTLNDYFRLNLKAGERISCEVLGARLGQDLDALVRVLDLQGNELLLADDDPATGADPRFVFTAPAAGQYLLELRDNRYKAGGQYRLRLGDFPLVATAMPLFAQRGVPSTISFAGEGAESAAPLNLFPVASAAGTETIGLAVRASGGRAASWASLALTDLPVFTETSSLADAEHVTPLLVPGVAAGMLETPGDRDLFQFTGVKGTPIRLRAISRSLGSAAVIALRVLDASGKQLAESPVTDSDEPVLNFTPPADGAYKLAIEELVGRGGPEYTYAVECRTGPQFSLTLKNDKLNRVRYALPAGGAIALDVQCQRAGYDGPISLSIDSPRAGWQTFNHTIAAKANEVKMYIVPPHDLGPGEVAELRIVGRGEAGQCSTPAVMATSLPLRTARPQLPYPPAWLDGLVFVAGANPRASFYTLSADRGEIELSRFSGEAKVTLAFERTDPKFVTVPLTVLPVGLPPGVTAAVKRDGNGAKEKYEVTLKGPKDLAEGQYTFRYLAYAELSNQGRALTGDLRLNVFSPLSVTVAPAGPLTAGQTQKIKLALSRRGDEKQPVDVKFKALPKGVSAPEKTTIAADQNEVEIELAAAADAEAVKFDKLVVSATSKVGASEITVESPAVTLEVKAP